MVSVEKFKVFSLFHTCVIKFKFKTCEAFRLKVINQVFVTQECSVKARFLGLVMSSELTFRKQDA